ncbi:hypothetical protein [Williamsia sp.]|uniref:hypothetical protein n=1 Tax=Williamsia sp. TaxID=1872085 RepID=UPI001A321479|nr:hypothetical protein [Williamsia sp.]MBJ7288997.1 hypothetical protein [Williamsia sp.]
MLITLDIDDRVLAAARARGRSGIDLHGPAVSLLAFKTPEQKPYRSDGFPVFDLAHGHDH